MTHLSNRHSVTFNPRSNDARAAANASAILSKTPERKKKTGIITRVNTDVDCFESDLFDVPSRQRLG